MTRIAIARLAGVDRMPDCARDLDVADAVASGRWPDRADADLRDHVAGCPACADLAVVASALTAEHEAVWIESPALPPADLVWHRARARARAEAAREAARPIAIMQAVGFAGAAAVMSALIGAVAWWVWTRTDLLAGAAAFWPAMPAMLPAGVDTMGFAIRGVLLAVGVWLLLAPVAVYLAAADD